MTRDPRDGMLHRCKPPDPSRCMASCCTPSGSLRSVTMVAISAPTLMAVGVALLWSATVATILMLFLDT